ncbi:hypothetical protein GYMLUDRAFT_264290 [Collybiopsis luxurians FD-317 M1]|uniref:DUF4470 domain-containing protein n=1 Tax=Collybiopsis luxurians FD-317 M1 TaxID=944289 RepID=A0A0D0AX41_9AGAR|nr:hypothetical protein GYMLUDRAFT_264290 [Collybiopsis luxurians FD-317 M1]
MAHPLVFSLQTYFYPIGNTTPVNLIQDIAPEESANILLLGCGDPRNIFFTLHSNTFGEKSSRTRSFVDSEPAVLARNILLFTLIIDNEPSKEDLLWNIFYDIYIDATAMRALIQQCRKLVNLAADVSTWHASSYGLLLRICTQQTPFELRRLWTLYERFNDQPAGRKTTVNRAFSEVSNKSKNLFVVGSSRSAGPFHLLATEPLSKHFQEFWSSGVHANDKNVVAKAKLINPTFLYSNAGEGFLVHYATDAFASFHLAPAFSDTRSEHGALPSERLPQRISCESDSLRAMRWPSVFYYTAKLPPLPRLTRSILLTPLTFDVVDTSNLADHLGLLNILLVISPLLSRTPHSSLYTETLLATGSDTTRGFLELACGDLTTISILLNLVPSSFVSRFNSHSNIHELALQTITDDSR